MLAQNLSVGAFVNRLDPLEELLQKKDCFQHYFTVTSVYVPRDAKRQSCKDHGIKRR